MAQPELILVFIVRSDQEYYYSSLTVHPWMQRSTEKVKVFTQEHNTMMLQSLEPQTSSSEFSLVLLHHCISEKLTPILSYKIHNPYLNIVRECPLILVLPGHQMFLMSWLSCHFEMRRKKSNKILKTVFFTFLVITSSVVKNKANKISGFASIITIKKYEWY